MKKKFFWLRNSLITDSNILFCLVILVLCSCDNSSNTSITKNCEPTSYDEIGPFYRPNAPIRDKVGIGYLLKGRVLSTNKCTPLPKAKLEFWLVNSNGVYDDAHRATVIADNNGKYSFESNRPTEYVGRLPQSRFGKTVQAAK